MNRCHQCHMVRLLCYCDETSLYSNTTPVTVLLHSQELKKQSNTGALAARCLKNSHLHLYGNQEHPLDWKTIILPNHRPLLLFPYANITLTDVCESQSDGKPIQLIVPDGSWRQGNKMARKASMHLPLQRVALPDCGPSQYIIRKEKRHPTGLATIEAIAHSYRLLGEFAVYDGLMKEFKRLVNRALVARGKLKPRSILSTPTADYLAP